LSDQGWKRKADFSDAPVIYGTRNRRFFIQYELDRGGVKKEIPLSQVASRDLLLTAQEELNIR
jgi:hypothetical protein